MAAAGFVGRWHRKEGHLCALHDGGLREPRLAEVEEQPRLPIGATARFALNISNLAAFVCQCPNVCRSNFPDITNAVLNFVQTGIRLGPAASLLTHIHWCGHAVDMADPVVGGIVLAGSQ